MGMLIVWPLYFFKLHDFARVIKKNHFQAWSECQSSFPESEFQVAYRAFLRSKGGILGGSRLNDHELSARRGVSMYLYLGAVLFMLTLGVGLYISVAAGRG